MTMFLDEGKLYFIKQMKVSQSSTSIDVCDQLLLQSFTMA
jgi:hypothetical protein